MSAAEEEKSVSASCSLSCLTTIDEDPHESRAVVAREPLRNHRTHVAYLQLLAAGPRDGRIAREITGQLPATRQQQRTRRDRYFRSHIHIPKGKDTFFTCK